MCQIGATTAFTPPPVPPPPNPKPLNPHAQPYKPSPLTPPKTEEISLCPPPHAFFRQHCHYFCYDPFYVYQPKFLWSPYQHKLERYNAYSQPLEGNRIPDHLRSVGDREKLVPGQVGGGLKKSRFSGGGDEKSVNRFISPRCRQQRKPDGENKKWALKKSPEKKEAGLDPPFDYQAMLQGNTSLMIKNIPNHFDRRDLLRILDKHCRIENSEAELRFDPCRSEYDFVYLPMDFGYCANLGYAFVNFTTSAAALRFCNAFDKHEWEVSAPGFKKKICEITCAVIQGKDGLVKNFENSKFSCHTRNYLPVTLSPARDGLNYTRPTLIGRCVGVGATPPVNRRARLMMKRREKASVN